MKIASWNVNSIRARMPNVLSWLRKAKPDILLMQEIKCENKVFPFMEFKSAGYEVKAHGQKSYNGVAIASLHPIEDVNEGLDPTPHDDQARYLEATVKGVRVACIYLPNGNPVESEKYAYKLEWMARLKNRAAELLKEEKPIVLAGDYNIIPSDIDVYDPLAWATDALFLPQSRRSYREIIHLGYTEMFRSLHPERRAYTFWDYQAGAWQKDHGLRIDHFLLSPEAVDRTVSCEIDTKPRAEDKASDHVPILIELV